MSELVDITMPVGQQEGTQSVIAKWLRKIGEPVKAHEPIIEISTDKVVMEVAAPEAGVLAEILQAENQSVQPGMVLGRIKKGAGQVVEVAGKVSTPQKSSAAQTDTNLSADDLSPAVRRLLRENKLSATAVPGTGRGGRITVEDVERFIASQVSKAGQRGKMLAHDHMRRAIAQHMVDSLKIAPHVTTVFEANLSKIIAHKKRLAPTLEAKGVKLSLTAYFVKAAATALQAYPQVNSRWHDDALELIEDANIGVATALEDKGLIVPVVRKAQKLSLEEVAEKLSAMVVRARDGKLETADVQDGTFTISNHGVSGSLFAAPIIINQPQSAILGIGKLENRVRAIEKGAEFEFKVEPTVYVTLTIDHRSLDGFVANSFLSKFVAELENWG